MSAASGVVGALPLVAELLGTRLLRGLTLSAYFASVGSLPEASSLPLFLLSGGDADARPGDPLLSLAPPVSDWLACLGDLLAAEVLRDITQGNDVA